MSRLSCYGRFLEKKNTCEKQWGNGGANIRQRRYPPSSKTKDTMGGDHHANQSVFQNSTQHEKPLEFVVSHQTIETREWPHLQEGDLVDFFHDSIQAWVSVLVVMKPGVRFNQVTTVFSPVFSNSLLDIKHDDVPRCIAPWGTHTVDSDSLFGFSNTPSPIQSFRLRSPNHPFQPNHGIVFWTQEKKTPTMGWIMEPHLKLTILESDFILVGTNPTPKKRFQAIQRLSKSSTQMTHLNWVLFLKTLVSKCTQTETNYFPIERVDIDVGYWAEYPSYPPPTSVSKRSKSFVNSHISPRTEVRSFALPAPLSGSEFFAGSNSAFHASLSGSKSFVNSDSESSNPANVGFFKRLAFVHFGSLSDSTRYHVGDFVSARDHFDKSYQAIIMQVDNNNNDRPYRVHFFRFSKCYNEWVTPDDITPCSTHVKKKAPFDSNRKQVEWDCGVDIKSEDHFIPSRLIERNYDVHSCGIYLLCKVMLYGGSNHGKTMNVHINQLVDLLDLTDLKKHPPNNGDMRCYRAGTKIKVGCPNPSDLPPTMKTKEEEEEEQESQLEELD